MTENPLRIAMVVIDANEVSGAPKTTLHKQSPVLHPAVHNVLEGLSRQTGIEVEVVYGRRHAEEGENRWDGALHYVPVPYSTLPLPGIGGPYLARLYAILRYLAKSKPDVIHAQGTEREAGMVAALCGRPTLLTLHGNFQAIAKMANAKPFDYNWINARLEAFILPRVSGVLCISRYTQNLVKPKNPRTWLLPNPASSVFFDIERKPVPNRIVCLGMIEERKNQRLLIEACDLLVNQGVNLQLNIWGPQHPDREYDQKLMRSIDDRPWCAYAGNAELKDIPDILSEASLLVLPSVEDNCPMVVIEAMAAGLPVVASNVGGIPDLVDHGRTGLLFESNQPAELADAIRTILTNEDTARSYSLASRDQATKRFRPETVAAEHVRIYRTIACQPEA